jgi:hypothetical protein
LFVLAAVIQKRAAIGLDHPPQPHRKPSQISLEQSIEAWELIKNSGYVIRTQSSGEVLERLSRNCTACPMSMKKRSTCLSSQIRQQ